MTPATLMLMFVIGSKMLLLVAGTDSQMLFDMQILNTPAAHPQINLPIIMVGIVKIRVIKVPMMIAAFITRIDFLRPNATTLPPTKLPTNRPTILEFENKVVYSFACAEFHPNFLIKTGAV